MAVSRREALRVSAVGNASDLRRFIALPQRLRRAEPDFVPQLLSEERRRFGPANPYWQHAKGQGFLAWRGDRPVGRVMALIDRLDQERHGSGRGHFGALEAADDMALRAVLRAAEDWLAARGATHVLGPMTLSTNEELGLLIEGTHRPAMLLMNQGPVWYSGVLEGAGYAKATDILAYCHDGRTPMTGAAKAMADRAAADPRIRVRPLNPKMLRADIDIIVRLFNEAWQDNWGFVPMTEAEIGAMADSLKPIIRPNWVQFAETLDDAGVARPVGMILALPDMNEALAGLGGRLLPFGWARLLWRLKLRGLIGARVLMMGVARDFQGTALGSGIGFYLIDRLWQAMICDGVKRAELSWILEDNQPMRRMLEATGAVADKRYRVYEKRLG